MRAGGSFAFGRKRTRLHQRGDEGGALARLVTALRPETPFEVLHAGERRDLQLLRKTGLQGDLQPCVRLNQVALRPRSARVVLTDPVGGEFVV